MENLNRKPLSPEERYADCERKLLSRYGEKHVAARIAICDRALAAITPEVSARFKKANVQPFDCFVRKHAVV
jgi:hypothetical protein